MKIDEKTFKAMPADLQVLFRKCQNPGSDEVVAGFPDTRARGNITAKTTTRNNSAAVVSFVGPVRIESGDAGDSGSAARFFYCAKASKKDRNAGLDRTYTVKYDVRQIGGLSCKDVSTALVESLRKATSGSAQTWLIGESGGSIMGLCPQDSLSITLMEISRITTSEILNLLMPLLTSAFIPDVKSVTENGGSHAVSAESSSECQWTSTSESQAELAHGARLVVSQMLSVISDSASWKPLTNIHSTVKPSSLMRYLCRLVTPPGGTVLDPFCGSGSTGKAAVAEGFSFIGIEKEEEYVLIAKNRIKAELPLFRSVSNGDSNESE